MRRIRNQHDASRVALCPVIGRDQRNPHELPLRPCSGLECEPVHSRYRHQRLLHLVYHLQGRTRVCLIGQGMEACQFRCTGEGLVHLGVVLHGAGTQRVEFRINTEVQSGEPYIVSDEREFVHLRQGGRDISPHRLGYLLPRLPRVRECSATAPGLAPLENQQVCVVHTAASQASTNRSISPNFLVSVTHTSTHRSSSGW